MSKTILITGATSGLGLELAKLYLEQNQKLILLGRQGPRELHAPLFFQASYLQCDLSQEGSALKTMAFLKSAGIAELDMVIHNAGVGYYGRFEEQSEEDTLKLLHTNLYAPISLSHALLPKIKTSGKLVFISSVAAHLPAAEYAVYAASKAALGGFARTLRLEQNRVKIKTIFPGAIRTAMHKKSGVPEGKLKLERFPSAGSVAVQVVKAIELGRSEQAIGFGNAVLRMAGRFFSGPMDGFLRRQVR